MLRNNKDLWDESDLHRILKRFDNDLTKENKVNNLSVSNVTSNSSSQNIVESTTSTNIFQSYDAPSKKRKISSNTIIFQKQEVCCCGDDHDGLFDADKTQHRCSSTQQKVFAAFCLTSYEGGAETTSSSGPCLRCRPPRKDQPSKNSKTASGQNSSISKKKIKFSLLFLFLVCDIRYK